MGIAIWRVKLLIRLIQLLTDKPIFVRAVASGRSSPLEVIDVSSAPKFPERGVAQRNGEFVLVGFRL